jgi:hypothetical protein
MYGMTAQPTAMTSAAPAARRRALVSTPAAPTSAVLFILGLILITGRVAVVSVTRVRNGRQAGTLT